MDFSALINPKSYALIGASRNVRAGSSRFIVALQRGEYQGKIYPVNPNTDEILGLKVYSDITAIPNSLDYVMIAVPARYVPAEVRKCVQVGAKFVVVFSSGFGEVGNEALERELRQIINDSSTRLLGPNCIGVYSTESRMCYFPDQLPGPEGNVTFISQSGGMVRTFIWTGFSRGFHLRAAISVGNQLDITIEDLLEFFRTDPKTKIVAIYLEGIKNGAKFMVNLKSIAAEKPVVILKCGRTGSGKRAVISHTGSIAGSNEIFQALMHQTGVIPVETFEELCDVVTMLSVRIPERNLGRNVAIVNTGGGLSVEATDIVESLGLRVPAITEESQERMKTILPDVNTIVSNPLDLGAAGFIPKTFTQVLEVLSQDPKIDVILTMREVQRFKYLTKRIGIEDLDEKYREAMVRGNPKNKYMISIMPKSWESSENFQAYQDFQTQLHAHKIPCYPTPIRAVTALRKIIEYVKFHSEKK